MCVTVFSNLLQILVADDISTIDLGSSLFLSKQSKWLGNQNRELENVERVFTSVLLHVYVFQHGKHQSVMPPDSAACQKSAVLALGPPPAYPPELNPAHNPKGESLRCGCFGVFFRLYFTPSVSKTIAVAAEI